MHPDPVFESNADPDSGLDFSQNLCFFYSKKWKKQFGLESTFGLGFRSRDSKNAETDLNPGGFNLS